jgi:phage baseplate assembly protein W
MAGTNRDDFPQKTKRALAQRANYRCSHCGIATSGPGEESPDAVVSIGVAAHINAAAPGGARYIEAMTPQERSHITNGIWMCATHSVLIDRDRARYAAELLKKMKLEHEQRVSREISGVSVVAGQNDFVALGPDLVFSGELTGTSANEWRVRVDHFLIGDLHELVSFIERFERVDSYDRYVLINALGDGRQLLEAPSWEKSAEGHIVSCRVRPAFPRTNAHCLPADIALNESRDWFAVNGDIAVVSGLEALPQKVSTCLSTMRGESPYDPTFGSRIATFFEQLEGTPWLPRLIMLEVIRLACIPWQDKIIGEEYTPMQSVRRVIHIEQLEASGSADWRRFRLALDVDGVGRWNCDIPVFVPERVSD